MVVHVKLFFIFVLIKCASSKEALVEPCNHTDEECFKNMTVSFHTKASAGIPEYGLVPTDPMELKKVEYMDPGSDIVMLFENIRIVGLKNQDLNDFVLNDDTKLGVFHMTVHVNIAAKVSIKLNDTSEFLSGTYEAKATSIETVKFSYNLKVDPEGVEHFIVGPETIDCEPVGLPEVILDLKYPNTVAKDPEVVVRRADDHERVMNIKERPVCVIISEAYKGVMSQVRSVMRALPKSTFFKDL